MIINDLVSIITPMYNSENFITEMIESVIKQSYENWELLIVDDCSKDNSCKIVQDLSAIDGRIKLIKHINNKGPAEARNTAIRESKGQFIAFLDSDDIWMEDKLSLQLDAMKKANAPISCTAYDLFSHDLSTKYGTFEVPDHINYKSLLKMNYFSCDTVIIDKTKIQNITMVTNEKHEDYVTWLKIMKEAKTAIGVNKPLAIYRLSAKSRSSNKLDGIIKRFFIYYQIEHLGLFKSLWYSFFYIIKGIIKYRKKLLN